MQQVVENVTLIDDLADVPNAVSRLRGYGVDVGYDIETTDTDPITSRMVALQFKPAGKKAYIIDVRHFSPEDLLMLGSMLEPLFDGSVQLVGHNLKFDLEFALAQMRLGAHKAYDTMLAEQVIFGMGISSGAKHGIAFGMKDLADRYGEPVTKEERSWFIHLDERPEWDEPFPGEQVSYMRQDVSLVHKLKAHQQPLITEYGLDEVIDLEMRALLPLVGVEVWGVQIAKDGWIDVIGRVSQVRKDLERTVHLGTYEYEGLDLHILKVRNAKYQEKWEPYAKWMRARDEFVESRRAEWDAHGNQFLPATKDKGPIKGWGEYKKVCLEWWYEKNGKLTKPTEIKGGVNLGSWMQVRDGFNSLGIPVRSVSEETLTPYIGQHPLVQVYIDYAHARKIETVYGTERGKKDHSFIELLDRHERLRASYQQIGADTGRMSSFRPNFQQIPSDGVGADLRRNVVAAPGYTLVVADFSNIELRIAAELSGDKFLLDAFASGMDIHAYTAIVMFNLSIPEGEDPKDWTNGHDAVVGGRVLQNTSYRKIAKTINYMLLYGAGAKRLAAMLRIDEADAKKLLSLYRKTFATVISFLDEQRQRLDRARERKERRVFAETRSGRRRWFDIPFYPKYPAKGSQVSVEAHEKWESDVEEWKQSMASIRRQLANTPIQGLSADITKLAAALWYENVGYDEDRRLVAIIHDEFILEVRPEYAESAGRMLESVMMQAMSHYLHVVEKGKPHAVQTPYWMH